jgi:hypothetical protein
MVKLIITFGVLLAALLQVSSSPISVNIANNITHQLVGGDMKLTEVQKSLRAGLEIEGLTGNTYLPWRWPMNTAGNVVIPYRFAAVFSEFNRLDCRLYNQKFHSE